MKTTLLVTLEVDPPLPPQAPRQVVCEYLQKACDSLAKLGHRSEYSIEEAPPKVEPESEWRAIPWELREHSDYSFDALTADLDTVIGRPAGKQSKCVSCNYEFIQYFDTYYNECFSCRAGNKETE